MAVVEPCHLGEGAGTVTAHQSSFMPPISFCIASQVTAGHGHACGSRGDHVITGCACECRGRGHAGHSRQDWVRAQALTMRDPSASRSCSEVVGSCSFTPSHSPSLDAAAAAAAALLPLVLASELLPSVRPEPVKAVYLRGEGGGRVECGAVWCEIGRASCRERV